MTIPKSEPSPLSKLSCRLLTLDPSSPYNHILAQFVLAAPSSIDSDATCFATSDAEGAFGLFIYSSYTPGSCHNIASVFSDSQDGNGTANCNSDQDCPDGLLPTLFEDYSPETNYSYSLFNHMTYRFSNAGEESEQDYSNFTMKVFPRENCEDSEEEPWFSWGGYEKKQEVCKEFPYGVASFRLELTPEEDLGECVLAEERGATGGAIRGKEASFGAAVLAAFGLMMLW